MQAGPYAVTLCRMYYADKIHILEDLWGKPVELYENKLIVDSHVYPIMGDVIILLEPSEYPPSLRKDKNMAELSSSPPNLSGSIAKDIQFTFGAEWQRFSEILPEHQQEFEAYFDVVDLPSLRGKRFCDLGCGIGRWSYFVKDICRELILIDFSEAIFVARRNLQDAKHALFFMGDIMRLPFRQDFADFAICLGVLHHLPINALDAARHISTYAPEHLIYLYYALDNKPGYFRWLLGGVTLLRKGLSHIRSPLLRESLSWLLMITLYLPWIGLGHLVRPLGWASKIPLYENYAGKTLKRIQQDVYDRFFTRIEQRFSRKEISTLSDTYSEIRFSERPPYWHFYCKR
jgi:SAM-dependent methyltransferase